MARRRKTPSDPVRRIRTATPASVRAVNRSILLGLIRCRQPVSRADLSRLTGIFRSSVSDIVDELLEEQLVTEERATPSQRGRVPFSIRLNENRYRVLGLNIRPAYTQVACAGMSGQIAATRTFETPASRRRLLDMVQNQIRNLRDELGMKKQETFRSIGAAIPGHVDISNGQISWAPTHEELNGWMVADELEARTGIPALADNDCNAGALSELWLSALDGQTEQRNFVFLNVSDYGVGAGVVLSGEIYRGHNARFAAEVGHMVVQPGGASCRCGRKGCWELYASNEATWKRYNRRKPFTISSFEEMLARAECKDAAAVAAFRETASYLALGVSNIGFLFNPAKIVVAGRIVAIWNLVKDEISKRYDSPHLSYSIGPARLSADDSLLHGAVCLGLRELFAPPKFGES